MWEYSWQEDAELNRFIADADADVDTVGLILSGSRGAGFAAEDSDYDLYWVLTDTAYDGREARGEALKVRLPETERRAGAEVMYACPRRLAETAAASGWWTAGYADARVLLDKTGQVAEALAAIRARPAEQARADVAGWFDAYLNAFYRSMKAWRRGDELGGRLQAAESAIALIRTLFALERRWPPYHDRLARHLDSLSDQGWPPGFLRAAVLDLLRTGSPKAQQGLEERVEALLRDRGFSHVVDAWDGEIDRVKSTR
jgi:hypothetical protein